MEVQDTDIKRRFDEFMKAVNDTSLQPVVMETVTLRESDIKDAWKWSRFKYIKLDVQNIHALPNSEKVDENTIAKEIEDVLTHWTELFLDGKSIKLMGGLRQYGKALE